MVVKEQKPHETEIKYNFNRKGGKSIIERQPVFAPDGELLAVIVENTVRVYNIQTAECVRVLETERHTEELIAIEFPHDEQHNLYGCSVGGHITVWTWENGAVLREKKLQTPPNMKILTFNMISKNSCLLTLGSPKIKHIRLVSYTTRTGHIDINYKRTTPEYYDMVCVALGWYNGERFAAVTNGTRMLFLQHLTEPHKNDQIVNHTFIRLTSVAVHNGTIAITDALGRVSLVRGHLFNKTSEKGREVLHWHFLPVMSVAFSSQGSFLYTGGMEKVLVKWPIGNTACRANEQTYMPRLPGYIRFIATNIAHVAVSLSNNSIIIANAQLLSTATILECGGLSPIMRALGGTLIYNPNLRGLLMPGRTGHLQLYSTESDKVLYNIDITQTNAIPSERYNLLPIDTEITCAAMNAKGTWLATSEYRNDGINYPEEKLKFWHASPKANRQFKLRTCVNLSHGGCNVVALAFDNNGKFCVSAGTDQKFRIWKQEMKSQKNIKLKYFTCITVCYYTSGMSQYLSQDILNNMKCHDVNTYGKEKRPYLREIAKDDIVLKLRNIHKENMLVDSKVIYSGMSRDDDADMGGIAMSQDGSLIAAWFGCKLTLWDSHLCNIRNSLAHPALRPKGLQVKFGSKDAAHYLVCTSENCLAVWSLLSLTIKWMVQLRPSCLAADQHSNRMAVVTQDNDLFVFTPHNPTPILTRKRLLNPETGVFKQITFGTSIKNNSIIIFLMRNNSELYTIEPEKKDESRLEVLSWKNQPLSKFSTMLAAQTISGVKSAVPTQEVMVKSTSKSVGSAVAEITLAAAYMVPPISLLVTSFLHQVSGSKEPEEIEPTEEIVEIEDPSSDEEEQKPLNGPTPRALDLWTPNYEAVKHKKLSKIVKEPFIDSESTSGLFGI